MSTEWLKIDNFKFDKCTECIDELKKNNFYVSPWIENIVKKYDFKFDKKKLPIILKKVKVKDLGFNGPTELEKIYKKIESSELNLVSPEVAIYSRILYLNQPTGEWLRFATPFKAMVDTDGVPHLPKLGKALGMNFIETYWSYPKAIFHPHNDFIVQSK
tara:strand:+ start:230 stop:706 length:477 start_codon:yes stop_codon:yes gene_type:complete